MRFTIELESLSKSGVKTHRSVRVQVDSLGDVEMLADFLCQLNMNRPSVRTCYVKSFCAVVDVNLVPPTEDITLESYIIEQLISVA